MNRICSECKYQAPERKFEPTILYLREGEATLFRCPECQRVKVVRFVRAIYG